VIRKSERREEAEKRERESEWVAQQEIIRRREKVERRKVPVSGSGRGHRKSLLSLPLFSTFS